MALFVRVLAALVAVAVYLVSWWLFAIGWQLLVAWWRGYHTPGYGELGMDAWWGWLVVAVWLIGLLAVAWWAAFRLPWFRRERHTKAEPT